jgi:glycosyltransferase involved in cell wall biosynthesis
MKKILILNTVYFGGGAAKVARQIFDYFSHNKDFDVSFAYGRGDKSGDKKVFKFGFVTESLIHAFLVRFFGIEGWGSYFSTKRLIKFIKKEKFDLIHIHNLHGYYLNFFTLVDYLGGAGIPVIWTLHDEWAITWLPAHSMGCLHCKNAQGQCLGSYDYPKTYNHFFAKYMLNKKKEYFSNHWSPIIICPANWLKMEIEKSCLKNLSVHYISNGVDINVFKPTNIKNNLRIKYNIPLDKKVIVFSISNLKDKNKGYLYIKELVCLTNKEDIYFVAIGNIGTKTQNNIKSVGFISNDKILADIYNLGDIFVYTSLIETLSLTVMEAMSCSLPTIAFDVNGLRDLITEREGILVEPKSVPKLMGSLKELIADEGRIKEMGLLAREKIVSNMSLNQTMFEYKKLYKDILKI